MKRRSSRRDMTAIIIKSTSPSNDTEVVEIFNKDGEIILSIGDLWQEDNDGPEELNPIGLRCIFLTLDDARRLGHELLRRSDDRGPHKWCPTTTRWVPCEPGEELSGHAEGQKP